MDATRAASRTAVLTCQGRAVADGRIGVGRFSDPTAAVLLRDSEREVVERVRAGEAPTGDWRARMGYELVRGCGVIMAPRTIMIDDAIRECANPQVAVLGAGLDGRFWRMGELADVAGFEIDHPASQQDKRERLGPLPAVTGALHFVAVDFSHDRLDVALRAAGHDPLRPTTWVWEGVVRYLTRRDVTTTVAAVAALSAPGSRLIVNYQARSLVGSLGRAGMRLASRAARVADPLADEPHRSGWTPAALRRLLDRHGFTVVRDDDLLTGATALGTPLTQRRSLHNGRVAVADRR